MSYGIADCGSLNGTGVNGAALPPAGAEKRIQEGDKIRIGRILLTLLSPESLHSLLTRKPKSAAPSR